MGDFRRCPEVGVSSKLQSGRSQPRSAFLLCCLTQCSSFASSSLACLPLCRLLAVRLYICFSSHLKRPEEERRGKVGREEKEAREERKGDCTLKRTPP